MDRLEIPGRLKLSLQQILSADDVEVTTENYPHQKQLMEVINEPDSHHVDEYVESYAEMEEYEEDDMQVVTREHAASFDAIEYTGGYSSNVEYAIPGETYDSYSEYYDHTKVPYTSPILSSEYTSPVPKEEIPEEVAYAEIATPPVLSPVYNEHWNNAASNWDATHDDEYMPPSPRKPIAELETFAWSATQDGIPWTCLLCGYDKNHMVECFCEKCCEHVSQSYPDESDELTTPFQERRLSSPRRPLVQKSPYPFLDSPASKSEDVRYPSMSDDMFHHNTTLDLPQHQNLSPPSIPVHNLPVHSPSAQSATSENEHILKLTKRKVRLPWQAKYKVQHEHGSSSERIKRTFGKISDKLHKHDNSDSEEEDSFDEEEKVLPRRLPLAAQPSIEL